MVFFTCQNCGEALQKPKVEKHYNLKCRNRGVHLTCVDCLKDFFGQDYNFHTKCISEADRYSAHGTVSKKPKNEQKQAKFVEMIPNLLNSKNLSQVQREMLTICSKFDNVPRKRAKFHNFIDAKQVKYKSEDVDSVFNILEIALKEVNNSSTKKKNSDKATSVNGEAAENTVNENGKSQEEIIETSDLKQKKSKKNKDKSNISLTEEGMSVESKDCIEDTKENVSGVSKKKLKKQKKYEKYLAELENEAKQEVNEDMELGESFTDDQRKSKKSKKSKNQQSGSNLTEHNGNENSGMTASEVTATDHKKGKKRKLTESICETTEKKLKKVSTEDEKEDQQSTFDWADVIIRVLQSQSDKELSLKRLSKKVINEYQSVKSDHRTYEDLLAKFNKKVKKTVGVRVLKDKAKLIEECDFIAA